jgi:dihydrofolate reductase
MTRLRVLSFSLSLDGYGAGPDQDLANPLGIGGEALHRWLFATATFKHVHGETGGSTGVGDRFAAEGFRDVGAWIIGRNMFGPVRGPWIDESWTGWWGDDPPFHVPVFVLTHHARPSLTMRGGTVFHFVTDGIAAAVTRAVEAAGDREVRIGGGVSTIRQFLRARLIDDLHFAVSPVLLGTGEAMWADIDLAKLGYRCTRHEAGENEWHVVIARQD